MGDMFDRILMLLEIVLLIWIVWQGEIIVKCERGVYQLQKEREGERAKWREQKRQQLLKKDSAPKTLDSSANLELPLPSEKSEPVSKTISVKSAAVPSTHTDIRVSTISTSK
jgi:hypothetical protein